MSMLASFLQGLVSLAWCSKRDHSGSSGKAAQKNGKPKIPQSGKTQVAHPEKRAAQRDLANESTDDSCPALGSSSGSDTEASSASLQGSPQPVRLEARPGLDLPNQLIRAAGHLNPCAEPYVPSDVPMALQGVLKKLSPEDAATVRHLFTVKNDMPSCVPGNMLQQDVRNVGAQSRKRSDVPNAETLVVLLNQAAIALEESNGKGVRNRSADLGKPWRSNGGEVPWRRNPSMNLSDESSLRSNLQKMAKYDDKLIFMVRKINKLGLSSPIFLRDYFEKFGAIQEVFVTHAIDKQKDPRLPEKQRIRPAGIGFVVMKKAEDVTAILQRDEAQHTLRGVTVTVCKYEYRAPKEETNKPAAPPWGDRFHVPKESTKGANESEKT